jgi:transcriptional regulator with XRE-family HTH domain
MIYMLRSKAKLTQEELANRSGTTQPMIARLEGGNDSRIPSLDLLSRIFGATGNILNITFHKA